MKPDREAVLVGPGEGRSFMGGLKCRIPSTSTGGAYCAFEVVTLPGQGVPPHVHSREDELYYILEGQLEIQCGQRRFQVEAGAMAVLPRGIPHAFRNTADTLSRALTVFIPGGFDEFVAELRQLPPEDAADEKKRDVIREKYGIRLVRPGAAEPGRGVG